LVGEISKEMIKENQWFKDSYNEANIDLSIITDIKKYLNNIKIKAFIGTWCEDSKREVPVLYKILNHVDFNYSNLELITVDKKKKAIGLEKGYNILRVPTFIIYKSDIEIGRFVEFSKESLEVDILKILSGKPYKHPYDFRDD
jgi:thiol-disulfide isomerase/thioredoxin